MGTYDLFHIGHLYMLKRLKTMNDENNTLIVGISTDNFNNEKKGRFPVCAEKQRYEIIKSIRYVDEVFYEESMDKKKEYILKYNADIFAIGDDWKGEFDYLEEEGVCKVLYLERTPMISTTELIEKIRVTTTPEEVFNSDTEI